MLLYQRHLIHRYLCRERSSLTCHTDFPEEIQNCWSEWRVQHCFALTLSWSFRWTSFVSSAPIDYLRFCSIHYDYCLNRSLQPLFNWRSDSCCPSRSRLAAYHGFESHLWIEAWCLGELCSYHLFGAVCFHQQHCYLHLAFSYDLPWRKSDLVSEIQACRNIQYLGEKRKLIVLTFHSFFELETDFGPLWN